jgi:hypothetical protein
MRALLALSFLSLCAISALSSCASWSSHLAAHSYLGVHLTGHDEVLVKTLTKDDVEQITALARQRPDIREPIYEIYVTSLGRADVSGGRAENTGDPVTGFKVRKDNGRWKIIPGSVYQTEVVITS